MVEAERELDAVVAAKEDVYVEEWTALPVEDVALAPLHPPGKVPLLVLFGPAAQVFDLQRQLDAFIHDLERALTVEQEAGAQDGVLLDAGSERLLEGVTVPVAADVLGHHVVIDAAEAFELGVVDHAGLQGRHRVGVLVVSCQRATLLLGEQRERLQARPVERGRRLPRL